MRAALRGFYSADVPDRDLSVWRPEDGDSFSIGVTAFVGPDRVGGEEMFDFTVCTARWLVEHPPAKNFAFVRNTIVLGHWDYETLGRALTDLCFHTEGSDWPEIALHLSRYGHWEYESYKP